MSLRTPEKVRKLQEALHAKARESPDYRFYALYDKVYRADVLEFAYRRCRLNGGAPGVDGERFEDIEAYGVERWLGELRKELRKKMYRPEAVLRVWIPKPDRSRRDRGTVRRPRRFGGLFAVRGRTLSTPRGTRREPPDLA